MKKSINVYIYSYKNKNLLNYIKKINDSLSGLHNVKFFLFDQNNINRKKFFNDLKSVEYLYIKWDDIRGYNYHRVSVLDYTCDFYVELSDTISLPRFWDMLLIKYCEDADIISGKNIPKINIDKFSIVKNEIKSNSLLLSNWIDTNLFITKYQNIDFLKDVSFLKSKLSEPLLSILYFNDKKIIKSLPDNFYNIKDIDHDYIPYSSNHKYNMFLDKINSLDLKNFEQFHNINFKNLKYLKYSQDDVNYYNSEIIVDSLDNTRFHVKINELKVI
jgi:hypothetical protein